MVAHAGGGGGGSTMLGRQYCAGDQGNPVSIADSATGALTWDTLGVLDPAGTILLNRSDLAAPTVLADGVYAVTVTVRPAESLTVGGGYRVFLLLKDGACGITSTSCVRSGPDEDPHAHISITGFLSAGDSIKVNVLNLDGATRTFQLEDALVQQTVDGGGGSSSSGGSQTVRLLGPYTVTQADVPNEEGAFFDLPYVPTHGDVILDVMCRLVVPFNAGGSVRLTVSDGATGNGYGSGWNLDTPSDTSVNGAEPMQDYLRVVDPGVGPPLFMGGTPPVAQTVRISYADTPVAVGEVALYFLVATPSL